MIKLEIAGPDRHNPTKEYALIDDEDLDLVKPYKWRIHSERYIYPTARLPGKKNVTFLHTLIMKTPKGSYVDHIDNNRLNNQKSNLRFATPAENSRNRKKGASFSSVYKGVSWNERDKNWKAQIGFNYEGYTIGYFAEERWAAMAYDIAAKDLFGEFAKLNFSHV